MKKNTFVPFRRLLSLATTFVLASTVNAQIVPERTVTPEPSESKDVVQLSPFTVQGEAGWVATETLGGTRLRTSLKNVPNQIETLTKDFMDDMSLHSISEALIYTANAENATHDYVTDTPADGIGNPENAGRFRGIAAGTLSRNFFQVSHRTENYNIERATIASGPNAILFGLGSPAGIVDATPARAQMRNRYGFSLSYDSESSKRATFDANTVLVPGKLAVRIMGLAKRAYTDKKSNWDKDERLYGTLTFRPFPATSIVLQYETAERHWNAPPRNHHFDNISLWFTADQLEGSPYTEPMPIWDNTSFSGLNNFDHRKTRAGT